MRPARQLQRLGIGCLLALWCVGLTGCESMFNSMIDRIGPKSKESQFDRNIRESDEQWERLQGNR